MNLADEAPNASLDSDANREQACRRRKFWLRTIWISLAGVVIPPVIGLVGTVIGMVGAFGELSKTGEADPKALANDISIALLTTMWGLVFSLIAGIVLIGVMIRFFTLPKMVDHRPANPSDGE